MSPPLGEGSEVAGKYRVVRHLGSGGMGHVYAALDLQRGETVALKVLPGDKRRDVRARSRLVLEGRAAAGLQHPGIVRVYDVGEAGEITYVAMELLEGEDLHERMHRLGALPIDEVLALARALLEAMSAMHDADIIHRDLKPRNLFLACDVDGYETLKVLDFGIAKILSPSDHALTDSGQVFGTLHYMAPEQLRGVKHADVRSEIWAAGAILYEALTGRPPFEADNGPELVLKIAIEMPDPVRMHRSDVPDGLRRAIARAMQRDPAARFASAREMLAAIDANDADSPTLLDADTRPISPGEIEALGDASALAQQAATAATAPSDPRTLPWLLVALLAMLFVFGVTRGSEAVPDPTPGAERVSATQAAAGGADGSTLLRVAEAEIARATRTRAAELAGRADPAPDAGSAACDVTPPHVAVASQRGKGRTSPASSARAPGGSSLTSDAPATAAPEHAGSADAVMTQPGAAGQPSAPQDVRERLALPLAVPSSAGELKRDEF